MKRRVIFLLFSICSCLQLFGAINKQVDSLLLQLDQAIEARPSYIEQREARISQVRQALVSANSDEKRFEILGDLIELYRSFNTDSAIVVIEERIETAKRLNNKEYINIARMNKADNLCMIGMYPEALEIMYSLDRDSLTEPIKPYYYHIYRTIYGMMADYAVTENESKRYAEITDQYRDTLLIVHHDNSLIRTMIQADQYNVHDEYDKAIQIMSDYLSSEGDSEHNAAISSYTLSESYRLKGDVEKQMEYLIISAIADIKSAVREYISLRKLAVLLYDKGDIDRSYSYVKICMEDAEACNARLRKLEILEIFPIINNAYQHKIDKQQAQMKWALISISILSILLIIAIFYVLKQVKKQAAARREVTEANKRLKELNDELYISNEKLQEANRSIAENSYLKEEYIGRYMDQCSVYIEKLDAYRKSLGKIAAAGNVDELYKNIKSSKFIDSELKEFYANFDDTFLHLFPNFVEEFNALLQPDERIVVKKGERMNTELRIFALIRLGITDSIKIAQFLRYSVTTIYNYRTKVRNKALGDRDLLEDEVMKIGNIKR